MKSFFVPLIALLTTPVLANPISTATCQTTVSLNASTNIWKSFTLHPNSIYAAKVAAAAERITDPVLKKKALRVARWGTFLWLESAKDAEKLEKVVGDGVPCGNIVGIVVKNLPVLKCEDGVVGNETWFVEEGKRVRGVVDDYANLISKYPSTAFALIIAPQILPSIITNNISSCPTLHTFYTQTLSHTLSTLSLSNTILYLDAGHGGHLGYREYHKPTAAEISSIYSSAGRPSQFRGVATNLANYNSWDLSPGEFDCADTCRDNPARNEKTYAQTIARNLAPLNVPAHAVVDTSRSGVQGLRLSWIESWCNVMGAGFGVAPGSGTGVEEVDAFVWGVEGGVSDGSSVEERECMGVDSYQPSPLRGEWNQGYFEMLVREARPEIVVD